MKNTRVTFAGIGISITYPKEITKLISLVFRDFQHHDKCRDLKFIEITRSSNSDSYLISCLDSSPDIEADWSSLAESLASCVREKLLVALKSEMLVSAAALATGDLVVLFPGLRGTGKSLSLIHI